MFLLIGKKSFLENCRADMKFINWNICAPLKSRKEHRICARSQGLHVTMSEQTPRNCSEIQAQIRSQFDKLISVVRIYRIHIHRKQIGFILKQIIEMSTKDCSGKLLTQNSDVQYQGIVLALWTDISLGSLEHIDTEGMDHVCCVFSHQASNCALLPSQIL